MIKVNLYTTRYPAPKNDDDDYCPDGECVNEENREVSFRELCDLAELHSECSSAPSQGDTHDWLIGREENYINGGFEEHTMHFSRDNNPRHAKYWQKALCTTGFAKQVQA